VEIKLQFRLENTILIHKILSKNSCGTRFADRKQGKLGQLLTRFMEGKSETQKKLIKLAGVVGVAALAIVANHFLNTG
jgi:hypothetical protein